MIFHIFSTKVQKEFNKSQRPFCTFMVESVHIFLNNYTSVDMHLCKGLSIKMIFCVKLYLVYMASEMYLCSSSFRAKRIYQWEFRNDFLKSSHTQTGLGQARLNILLSISVLFPQIYFPYSNKHPRICCLSKNKLPFLLTHDITLSNKEWGIIILLCYELFNLCK